MNKKIVLVALFTISASMHGAAVEAVAMSTRKALRSKDFSSSSHNYLDYTMVSLFPEKFLAEYPTSKMAAKGYAVPKNKLMIASNVLLVAFLKTEYGIDLTSDDGSDSFIWYVENAVMADFYAKYSNMQAERDLVVFPVE